MNRNYQKELDQLLERLQQEEKVPKLLLHSCCAPCSSYVIEYLSAYFHVMVFYYNPNIYPDAEYDKRVAEQQRFIKEFPIDHISKSVNLAYFFCNKGFRLIENISNVVKNKEVIEFISKVLYFIPYIIFRLKRR